MIRTLLSNEVWARIESVLLGNEGDPGRTATDNRWFVEAVLWISRKGCPWRDSPKAFGRWHTVALFAPYGRMQFLSTLLRHYRESDAGAFDLACANQRLTMVSAVAGLRGEHGVPVSWGALKLRGRVEYSHALTGNSTARLGYADTSDNSYALTVLGLSENQLTTGVGVDLSLAFGLTTGLTYQGMFGMSDHTANHQVMVRVSALF